MPALPHAWARVLVEHARQTRNILGSGAMMAGIVSMDDRRSSICVNMFVEQSFEVEVSVERRVKESL